MLQPAVKPYRKCGDIECGFSFLNLTADLHEVAMTITKANAASKGNKCITQKLPMHFIDFSCHKEAVIFWRLLSWYPVVEKIVIFLFLFFSHVLQHLCLQWYNGIMWYIFPLLWTWFYSTFYGAIRNHSICSLWLLDWTISIIKSVLKMSWLPIPCAV